MEMGIHLWFSLNTAPRTAQGALLTTCLLDHYRVVAQSQNERNFHIFYYLSCFQSGDSRQLKKYRYRHLFNNHIVYFTDGNLSMPTADDAVKMKELDECLSSLSFSSDEKCELFDIVIGILIMGNVTFAKDDKQYAVVDGNCTGTVNKIAELFSVKPAELSTKFQSAVARKANRGFRRIRIDKAITQRDLTAQALYRLLVRWLVSRVNAHMKRNPQWEASGAAEDCLSVLDLPGFAFDLGGDDDRHSFYDFFTKYVEVTIQKHFYAAIIEANVTKYHYQMEGVMGAVVSDPNSFQRFPYDEYLLFVDVRQQNGFVRMLRSATYANSEYFLRLRLLKCHANSTFVYEKRKIKREREREKKRQKKKKNKRSAAPLLLFVMRHEFEEIEYDASQFVERNVWPQLDSDWMRMFKRSANSVLKAVVLAARQSKKMTTAHMFGNNVSRLLDGRELSFILCFNSNKQKSDVLWNGKFVQRQLRKRCVVNAVKVLRFGHALRIDFAEVYETYRAAMGVVEETTVDAVLKGGALVRCLLRLFRAVPSEYVLGFSTLFVSPNAVHLYNQIVGGPNKLSDEQKMHVASFNSKKKMKK